MTAAAGHRSGHNSSDAALRAQQAAEAHLMAVWEAEQALDDALDGQDADGAPADVPESPASAPWDGCDTCTVREVLHAAWPILHADVIAQLRDAGHVAAAEFLTDNGPDGKAPAYR